MVQEKTVHDGRTGSFFKIEEMQDETIIVKDPKSGNIEEKYPSEREFREDFGEENLFIVPREAVQRPAEYVSQRIYELRQYEENLNVYDISLDYALEVTKIEEE